ncbi:hypothetical protein LTR47_001531 [Exophiala xenobiotica]|nr:hypothetical protein LTR41_003422 [Exophiala xenobiotica]KAK5224861.1 hypothetical protein LTR72_004642 [Exophiala xenobiotica]KAK5237265.1 hypothetical protein LTR47_001531 [Exophiala xenobiotica]KAK5249211.1 hypothetical protein LTS06_005865 [Exophiala xenobiotica]KAK5293944.1 hypothetical protein LTR14_004835 [Exophiala xenobiotica]
MSRLSRASIIISSLLTCLPLCTQAHMQMSWPYPLKSPLDPDVPYYDKDYSMTSPLLADGSDFSCKHYQYTDTYDNADVIKATYYAGNTYNMTITGAAPHNGGSCQLSLSYDNGATFKVIKSMIGGCPITLTYDFTIPSYAPASDSAIFSWSWFNLAGNREMYQNCARVQIASNPSQKYRRSLWKRQTSIDELPDMFVCNVDNGCTTIEGSEVVFPDPGNDVVYGQDLVVAAPGPGYTSDGTSSTTSAAGTGSSTTSAAETGSSTSSSAIESPASTPASTTAASYVTVTGSPSTLSTEVTGPTTTAAGSTTLTTATIPMATTTTPPYPIVNATTTATGSLATGTGLPSTNGTLIIVTGDPITLSTSASTSTSDMATTTSTSTSTTTTRTSTTSSTSSSTRSTSTTLSSSYIAITSPSSSSSSHTTSPVSSVPSSSSSSPSPSPTSSHTTTTLLVTTLTTTSPTSTSTPTLILTTPSTSPTTTTTTSSSSATATAQPTTCTPGTFSCNSVSTFSQCVATSSTTTTYIYMGSVAAGMQCVGDGTIERQNAGPCTPSGSIFCNGTNAFYMCDQGGLIDMGPVAPGTACRDGVIGFA